MKVDQIILSFLVFSLVMFLGLFMIVDVNTNYGTSISTDLIDDEAYNTLGSAYNVTSSARSDIEGSEQEDTDQDNILLRAFNAVKRVTSLFGVFTSIVNSVANAIGLGNYLFIVEIGIIAFSVMLIFSIAYFAWGFFR